MGPSSQIAIQSETGEAHFWALVAPLLLQPGIRRSMMMGYRCVQVEGAIFAMWDRREHAMVIKLPEARAEELLDRRRAQPFAPNGRPFRQWVAVPVRRRRSWGALLEEAHRYVRSLPPPKPRPRRPPRS
ncbi:MAG: hypothetical protein ACKV2O_20585 [Acidimicrobiales bacterium]